jgi:hypothetical protein
LAVAFLAVLVVLFFVVAFVAADFLAGAFLVVVALALLALVAVDFLAGAFLVVLAFLAGEAFFADAVDLAEAFFAVVVFLAGEAFFADADAVDLLEAFFADALPADFLAVPDEAAFLAVPDEAAFLAPRVAPPRPRSPTPDSESTLCTKPYERPASSAILRMLSPLAYRLAYWEPSVARCVPLMREPLASALATVPPEVFRSSRGATTTFARS